MKWNVDEGKKTLLNFRLNFLISLFFGKNTYGGKVE